MTGSEGSLIVRTSESVAALTSNVAKARVKPFRSRRLENHSKLIVYIDFSMNNLSSASPRQNVSVVERGSYLKYTLLTNPEIVLRGIEDVNAT